MAANSMLEWADKCIGVRSDILTLQMQGRLLKESGIDVPLDANVIYCNLTLRPLGILDPSGSGEILPLSGHADISSDIMAVEMPQGEAYYLASAVRFYETNISPNLPEHTSVYTYCH